MRLIPLPGLPAAAPCLSLGLSLGLSLAGCGSESRIPSPADLPIVYKIDVQQGNLVTQDMLAQLQPGMDKAKVKYVMGTPLVVDVFHQHRWDYVYSNQERGGKRMQRRVSLYFKDDKLDRIEGDVKPASGAIVSTEGTRTTTVEVPAEEKGLVSRLKDQVNGDEKKEAAKAPVSADAAKPAAATSSESAGVAAPAASAPGDDATAVTTPAPAATGGGEFLIDNNADDAPATQPDTEATVANTEPMPSPGSDGALMPRFQSESSLEDAVLLDDAASAADRAAAEAAAGADSQAPAAGTATAKTTAIVIPDDAPPPPKKGFFRRVLEKVGVGDNEEGEYQSADVKYKDPSNPDSQ